MIGAHFSLVKVRMGGASTWLGLGQADRNDGNPELTINRDRLLEVAGNRSLLLSYLLHEIVHTTRIGWANRTPTLNEAYEGRTNDVLAGVLTQIGRGNLVYTNFFGGYGTTSVQYHASVPTT
jgi:hypothetical protein